MYNRYRPTQVDLETKIKAFIPDYIPAVGEVDAFLKPSKPDGQPETLGLLTIVKSYNVYNPLQIFSLGRAMS